MWSSENEGARFGLTIATELKNRGLQDIFICCVDRLSRLAQTLESGLSQMPRAALQRPPAT